MPDFKFPKSEKYNFGKNLAKRHRLVPHLDKYFTKEVAGLQFTLLEKAVDYAWHPSGDCTPSPNDLYLLALDRRAGLVEKSFSKAFPVGHFWHALCQKAVVDLGFAEESAIERKGYRGWGETKWKPGTNVEEMAQAYDPEEVWLPFHYCTGAADVAPLLLPDTEPMVVDFKTMGSRDYKNVMQGKGLPYWAVEKYEAQINIYMDFFDYDLAIILAINKDTPHDMCEIEYRRNQPLIDAIYEKWEFVSECLDDEEPPDEEDDEAFSLEGLFEGPIAQ